MIVTDLSTLSKLGAGFAKRNAGIALTPFGQKKSTDMTSLHSADQAAPPMLRDLLDGKTAEERKTYPLYEGLIGYFRDAMYRVARVSWDGNNQHNPGQKLHWARGKSKDQMDCVMRHASEVDLHDPSDFVEVALASMVWRALATLQLYLEWKYNITPPVNARSDD